MPNTVLIIEDEPLLRNVIEDALSDAGFRTAPVGSGGEAMLLLDHPPPDIVAIICDIRLGGGISGWVVARHAREMMPELPVIYISGDSGVNWQEEGVPGSAFLAKPFTATQIIATVRSLLPGGIG